MIHVRRHRRSAAAVAKEFRVPCRDSDCGHRRCDDYRDGYDEGYDEGFADGLAAAQDAER